RLEDVGGPTRLAGDLLAADEMPIFDHRAAPSLSVVGALCATILRTAIREIAHRLCENVLRTPLCVSGDPHPRHSPNLRTPHVSAGRRTTGWHRASMFATLALTSS